MDKYLLDINRSKLKLLPSQLSIKDAALKGASSKVWSVGEY